MKLGHCKQCPKREVCGLQFNKETQEYEVICRVMRAELRRVENPRRKKRIEVVYESDMPGSSQSKFEGCVWGNVKDE